MTVIGETFAILETEGESNNTPNTEKITTNEPDPIKVVEETVIKAVESTKTIITNSTDRFYSPLVKSMASSEGIEMSEMESIQGSGKDLRHLVQLQLRPLHKTEKVGFGKLQKEKQELSKIFHHRKVRKVFSHFFSLLFEKVKPDFY